MSAGRGVFARPAGGLLILRLACAASCCFCLCPVLPGPACWKCARVLPCAAFFVYLLPFSASLLPLKILFICRSGRDGPLLSSEKKVDKDSRGGAVAPPSNPHSSTLRPISPFPALLAGLRGPLGRKPPADRETFEKPRSRAQLFKRFCAKGNACALRPVTPFFSLLAGLTALWAANRRLARETPEKPKEQSSAFRAFLCVGERVAPGFLLKMEVWRGLSLGQVSSRAQGTGVRLFPCPGKQTPCPGPALGTNRVRARRRERKDRVRELPGAAARACEAGRRHKPGARIAHRRCARRRRYLRAFVKSTPPP